MKQDNQIKGYLRQSSGSSLIETFFDDYLATYTDVIRYIFSDEKCKTRMVGIHGGPILVEKFTEFQKISLAHHKKEFILDYCSLPKYSEKISKLNDIADELNYLLSNNGDLDLIVEKVLDGVRVSSFSEGKASHFEKYVEGMRREF